VSPVRYELVFYIPEDGILHSHRRKNLGSHICITMLTLHSPPYPLSRYTTAQPGSTLLYCIQRTSDRKGCDSCCAKWPIVPCCAVSVPLSLLCGCETQGGVITVSWSNELPVIVLEDDEAMKFSYTV
jgi:hypothetical protein